MKTSFHKWNVEKLMCVTCRPKWINRCAFLLVSFLIHQLNGEERDSKDLEECTALRYKEPQSLSAHRWKDTSLEAPVLDVKQVRKANCIKPLRMLSVP